MAHELSKSTRTGRVRMFSVKEENFGPPWHAKETKPFEFIDPPTCQEVIECLDAETSIHIRDLFDQDGNKLTEVRETWRPDYDKNGKQIYLDDGRPKGTRLGIVGPDYEVLQDDLVVRWLEPWINEGLATYNTGGAIFNGSRFWILGKLNNKSIMGSENLVEVAKDDPVCPFILITNGHDMKRRFTAIPTTIRVVCRNTLHVALKSKFTKKFSTRHRANIFDNIGKIRTELALLNEVFGKSIENFKLLASKEVKNKEELKNYFKAVTSIKEDDDNVEVEEKKDSTKNSRTVNELMTLFENDSIGNATYWKAFNAITQWTTHMRGHNLDSRLENMFVGQSQKITEKAMEVGLKMVAGVGG